MRIRISRIVAKLPLIGSIVDAPAATFNQSFWDLVYTQVLSTAPTWLSGLALLLLPMPISTPHTAGNRAVLELLGHGELFLYSAATLAPVFILAVSNKKYPGRELQILLSIMIITASGFLFGSMKYYREIASFLHFNIDSELMIIIKTSAVAFGISLLIEYVVGVLRYAIDSRPPRPF